MPRFGALLRIAARATLASAVLPVIGRAHAMPPVVAAFQAGSGTSHLTFSCGSDRTMWLEVSGPHAGWGRNTAVEIRIGARRFRLRVVPEHDTLLLSNLRAPGKGVSRALISTAKSGLPIELTGPASKEIPPGLRAFRLERARLAIENVETSCGLAPAP